MSLRRTSTLSRRQTTKEEEKTASEKRADQLAALKVYLEEEAKNQPPPYKSKTNKTTSFDDVTLFLAASALGDLEEVERLLKGGVNVNGTNSEGLTALHEAVAQESVEMINVLLKNGADINVQDNEGWTPLHAVCHYGFTEIAKLLLDKGADPLVTNFDNDLPVDVIEDDDDLREIVQDFMTSKGITEEMANSRRNQECNKMLEDVMDLLRTKPDCINGQADDGTSLLHIACGKGYLAVVITLLEKGANPNIQDREGWTPLHAAAYWDKTLMFEPLLTFGGDLDIVNNENETSLDVAENAETREKLEELREKLKKRKGGVARSNSSVLRRGLKMEKRTMIRQNEEDEFPKSPTKG